MWVRVYFFSSSLLTPSHHRFYHHLPLLIFQPLQLLDTANLSVNLCSSQSSIENSLRFIIQTYIERERERQREKLERDVSTTTTTIIIIIIIYFTHIHANINIYFYFIFEKPSFFYNTAHRSIYTFTSFIGYQAVVFLVFPSISSCILVRVRVCMYVCSIHGKATPLSLYLIINSSIL